VNDERLLEVLQELLRAVREIAGELARIGEAIQDAAPAGRREGGP